VGVLVSSANILKSQEGQWVVLGLVAIAVVYYVGKHLLSAAGGVITGDNALTQGTPYQGAGVPGTLGAVANDVSGGTLSTFGSWLGGLIPDGSSQAVSYNVIFPDGSRHYIQSSDVTADGYGGGGLGFVYQGVTYSLGQDSNGNHVAYAR